jgi:Flp pilus assembly protein TadG
MRLTTRRGRYESRQRSKGQALVEFAFTFPIFILIVLAVIEGGAFAFTYASLQHATQEGGRLAILPDTATVGDVQQRVVDRAVAIPVTTGMVSVTVAGGKAFAARETGDEVQVLLNYVYQPLTSMVFGAGVTINMAVETEYVAE